MKRFDRLIFVSNSDTYMGPMAKGIMRSKYLLSDLDVDSRGLVVLFPEPINPKAEAILVSNGLTMKDHMSDPLVKEDAGERTLLLAVSEEVKQKVRTEFGDEFADSMQVLNTFVGVPQEIFNPYGGSLADYGQCFTELETLISKLVVQLNEEELLC